MMKILLLPVLIFFSVSCFYAQQKTVGSESSSFASKSQLKSDTVRAKIPVLVELFTSEGCPTCPPAERVLAVLQKEQTNPDAEIITLALHVDYWNRGGWTDEFSSPLYSQRQEIYGDKFKIAAIYTPQMVVDGSRQFIGSNLNQANKVISEAAKTPKANVELSESGNNLKISISDVPKHTDATVFLAIAEDNLSTRVGGGENGGRTLEHTSVVRELKPLGRIFAADNKFELKTVLQLQPDWKRENLKAVVFIQENQSRKIMGIGRIKIDK
ncbi:MAG: DUF1223 domain-containing protein [Pyrinomonadaceae bacterium]